MSGWGQRVPWLRVRRWLLDRRGAEGPRRISAGEEPLGSRVIAVDQDRADRDGSGEDLADVLVVAPFRRDRGVSHLVNPGILLDHRPLVAADADLLWPLLEHDHASWALASRRALAVAPTRPLVRAFIEDLAASGRRQGWLVWDEAGEVTGVFTLRRRVDRVAETRVWVAAPRRRCGYGSAVLDTVAHRARAEGHDAVEAVVGVRHDPRLIRFLERNNFDYVGVEERRGLECARARRHLGLAPVAAVEPVLIFLRGVAHAAPLSGSSR